MENRESWRWKLGCQCGQTFSCDEVSAGTLPTRTVTNQPITIFIDAGRRHNSWILWVTAQQRVYIMSPLFTLVSQVCQGEPTGCYMVRVFLFSLLCLQQVARQTHCHSQERGILYPARSQEQTASCIYFHAFGVSRMVRPRAVGVEFWACWPAFA